MHPIDPAVVADLVTRNWTTERIAFVLDRSEDEIKSLALAGGAKPAPSRRATWRRRARAKKALQS